MSWWTRAGSLPPPDTRSWRPTLLHPDDPAIDALFDAGAVREVHDTILDQLGELVEARAPRRRFTAEVLREAVEAALGGEPAWRYGRWVHYPWSGRLVHLLPPDEHFELRTDRNRYKITPDEQARLRRATIGVVGLSVGQSAALTLALEGVGGRLRVADFDTLGASNLNRLRAGVHELGVSKCVIAARAIAEIDPYLPVEIFPAGVDPASLPAFLDGLDLLVEECDDLRMKLLLREGARARRIPVVMDTSDRGLLDVERFDREPDRPLLHGLVGALRAEDLAGLPTEDKIPHVLRIVGEETLSTRFGASLPEVRESISTWPQLASGVALGGALVTDTARRVLLGGLTTSGRFWVDLEGLVRDGAATLATPAPPPSRPAPLPESVAFDAPPPRVPDGAPTVETARALVAAAVLAPSGHNAQPWRFHWDGRLTGRFDPARRLHALDFRDGGAWTALGAASLNAELAARAAGLAPTLDLGPTADDPLRAFTLRLGQGPAAVDPLLRFIGMRLTNRRLGARAPLGDAASLLAAEATAEGCALALVEDPPGLDALAGALGAGDRLCWLFEPLQHEIVHGLRWSPAEVAATLDGLDVATLELSDGDRAALRVITRAERAAFLDTLGLGRALEDAAHAMVAGSSAIGLLRAPGAGPGAYVRGGRAMQRAWLRATSLGLALHPIATLPYLFARQAAGETRGWPAAVRDRIAAIEATFRAVLPAVPDAAEVLLFRLAHAPPATARSVRRRVDDVLTVA